MVGALLVLLGSTLVASDTRTPDPVRLHARVYAERGVDGSTVERAQAVARKLLSSAGIDLVWRLCVPSPVCDAGTGPEGEITIVLSAEALSNQKIPKYVEKHIRGYFDQINRGK